MAVRKNFDLGRDHQRGMRSAERAAERFGLILRREARNYINRKKIHVDGDLSDSVNYHVERFLDQAIRLTFGANSDHAIFVHDGTKPREKPPPYEAIEYWVRKKLNIVQEDALKKATRAIQWSIKHKGTSMRGEGSGKGPRPRPFIDVALARHQRKFVGLMQDAYLEGVRG